MANIKSFDELGGGRGGGSDSDDDNGGFNDYYAGGEKSGQLIRGAPKQDEDEDKVGSLFDRAKRAGAVQGTSDDLQKSGAGGNFQGTGRTLAGGTSRAPQQQGPVTYIITFYGNNVFTVNDGPPRKITDPENRSFMESISKGECPEELEPEVPGTPITVNLVRNESDYQEPDKPKYTAFQGTGRTLAGGGGGSGGSAAGPSSSSAAGAAGSSSSSSVEGEWQGVNEGAPTTSLQLRLADGSRMVARFNHTHRISDIRRFIRAARPDVTFSYSLMAGVPPQPVTDEERTLEEAGLLNSVIIQKK